MKILSIIIILAAIIPATVNAVYAYGSDGGYLIQTPQLVNSTNLSQITVNNQTLQYSISDGTILSVKFNQVLPSLEVSINAKTGGTVTLYIPRNLIDSKDRFGSDAPFVVSIDGREVQANEQQSNYARTLAIQFQQGNSMIEIVGTGVAHLKMPIVQPIIKITNPAPNTKDLFGTSLAELNGNIIIGAPNAYSANYVRGGIVYLFDDTGKRLLSIPDPDNSDGDQFGFAVTSFEDKIIVGAPNAFSSGIQSGKAYLFDSNGQLLQTITDPDPHAGDQFGYSFATTSNNFMIGSPSHVNDQMHSGSVYVFDSTGNQLLGIQNPDKENADLFGFSMVPIGDQLAVGAPDSNHDALQAGSVFLFDLNSGNLKLTLRNPDPDNRTEPNQGSDQFGFSLANNGNYLVVGERGGDIKHPVNGQEEYMVDQSGNVRIYDLTGKLVQTIDDPHPIQNNDFGVAVAASGNKILIGMNHDDTVGFDAGSAFLYDISGNMTNEIQNPSPTPVTAETMGNYFGSSVLFLKDKLVIGSPGDNSGATNAGAVYVMQNTTQVVSPPPSFLPPTLTPQAPIPVYLTSSPLKQFESGVAAKDVTCNSGFQLIFKAEDGSPACVKPQTAQKLVERVWGQVPLHGPSTQNTQATNMTGSSQSSVADGKQANPLGVAALVVYSPYLSCVGPCPPYNFYLKANSNSTAYLLGYDICGNDLCIKNDTLSILLPKNNLQIPNYTKLGLSENKKWNYGDTVNMMLEISPSRDNKTAYFLDIENSTIVP